jgi:hypothetical protein
MLRGVLASTGTVRSRLVAGGRQLRFAAHREAFGRQVAGILMEAEGTRRVAFAGALTMRGIDVICSDLRAAIAGADSVVIDCAAAEAVDVGFIQFLLAARLAGRRNGVSVCLAAPPQGTLLDALTRAGFRVESGSHAGDEPSDGPAGGPTLDDPGGDPGEAPAGFWFAGGRA